MKSKTIKSNFLLFGTYFRTTYLNYIKDQLINNEGIWVDRDIIIKILKEKLHYSFKRCSHRPLKHERRSSKFKKILFSVKICKMKNKSTILVNVDESIFSSSTKSNYSWGKKGFPLNILSIIFKGSISIVSAIISNGISFTRVRIGTIKSKTFVEYIKHLLSVWNKL